MIYLFGSCWWAWNHRDDYSTARLAVEAEPGMLSVEVEILQ